MELLRFRLLRLMTGSGIKAKEQPLFVSSNLLRKVAVLLKWWVEQNKSVLMDRHTVILLIEYIKQNVVFQKKDRQKRWNMVRCV